MIRYAGQPLPENPRIGVIANDALGNFVMATPLLQLLRAERKPERLTFFGGARTWELQAASDLCDQTFVLQGATVAEVRQMLEMSGQFDLMVNLESTPFSKAMAGLLAGEEGLVAGPCIGAGGRGELPYASDDRGRLWADREWTASNLISNYPFLRSGFISEIFARLCYLEGELPPYRVPMADPGKPIPDVLIATAASLPEKLWDVANWRESIERLRLAELTVGLIGAKPSAQSQHWHGADAESELIGDDLAEDLRGKWTLPQVVGALARARAVLSLDNGVLHLAVAAGTPTVGLYRHGIHRLWAPPSPLLRVLTPGEGAPVSRIPIEDALAALGEILGQAI